MWKRYRYVAKLAMTFAATRIICSVAFLYTSQHDNVRTLSSLKSKLKSSDAIDHKTIPLSSTLPPCFQYVAKTTESFKFADLYWLHAAILAYCEYPNSTVEKLALHRPTASLLLGFSSDTSIIVQDMPFPSNRVQYIGRVIASGATAKDLLVSIAQQQPHNTYWTLDCDTFEPLADRQFTTSMLMCAVSRHLSGNPLLDKDNIDDATISYLLVETSSKLYLIEKLPVANQVHDAYDENVSRFRQEWSRRPFQYSGAVNIDIAITVADMLRRLLQKDEEGLRRIRVVDPTVGSGTFLAAIVKLWNAIDDENMCLDIVGIDSNSKCSQGATKNICKLLDVESVKEEEDFRGMRWTFPIDNSTKSEVPGRATIYCADSVELLSNISPDDAFDCVISNLPWNRNTFEYKQDKSSCTCSDIMKRVAEIIKPSKPVIVVSGSDDGSKHSFNAKRSLNSLGFDVIGEVSIPPKGFLLPDSGKKKKNNAVSNPPTKIFKSSCVVTVAISPKH